MIASLSALSVREDAVGLDIGDGLAVAARIRRDRRGRLRLKEAAWTPYNSKASGADIAALIRRMWRQAKLSRFSVVSCLRSRALTLKRFQLHALSDDEMASALQLEAEDALQMAPGEVALDWYTNPEPMDEMEGERDVTGTLVAVPRRDVNMHVDMLKQAALYPVITDVSCFALANLFHTAPPVGAGDGACCLARLGVRSADIMVMYDQNAIYPRTVFVHAGHVTDPTRYFADSIKDVLSYCRFKLHLPEVSKLFVTGVVDAEKQALIERTVGTSVTTWDPLVDGVVMKRSLARRLESAEPPVRAGLAVAMGLALRGEC